MTAEKPGKGVWRRGNQKATGIDSLTYEFVKQEQLNASEVQTNNQLNCTLTQNNSQYQIDDSIFDHN